MMELSNLDGKEGARGVGSAAGNVALSPGIPPPASSCAGGEAPEGSAAVTEAAAAGSRRSRAPAPRSREADGEGQRRSPAASPTTSVGMSRGPSHQPPPNATASSQHRKPSEPRGAPHHLAQESFLASGSSAAASQHRKLSSDPRGAPHHPAQEPFLASSSAASQPRRPSDPRSAPQSREQFLASSAATLAGASQHRKSSTEQRGASQSQEHRRPSDPRGPPQSREQFQAGSSSSAAAASQHRKLSSEQRGGAPPYYSQEQFQASTSSAAAYSQYRRPSDPRAPPFSEEEFLSVSRELAKSRAKPDAPWHLLYEAMGLSIYRLHDEKTGLYEYKLYGVIVDCSPEQLAEVYMDLQYRTKWDRYCKELNEKTCDGRTAIYWQAKFPFPLANRDYVFTRELRVIEVDGRKIYVVLSKSVATSKFPEKPGIIRVKNYKQCVAIESDGKKGSRVYMFYFDNPGGKLPSWFINWATKTAVPNYLKDMQKACVNLHKKRHSTS